MPARDQPQSNQSVGAASERVVHERRGRWYDELTVGDVYLHRPGRTISEAENTLFSLLTMAAQTMHVDAHAAAESDYGRLLVPATLTLSILVGLSASELTEKTGIANLAFSDVRFPLPVFPGDTIRAETQIVGKRLSRSRPGAGIVEFELRARNQDGEIVCSAGRSALVRRAPDEKAGMVGGAEPAR